MAKSNGTTAASEQAQRVAYCKEHNIHHLFELLASRVLVERPTNPFAFLRQLLTAAEASEQRHGGYDATRIPSASSSLHMDNNNNNNNNNDNNEEEEDVVVVDSVASETTATTTAAQQGTSADRHDGAATNAVACVAAPRRDAHTPSSRYKITLGLFGLDNAGKTSVLAQLEGEVSAQTLPTVGFTPAQFQTSDSDVYLFDLGGAANFRGIWQHYFHDCHGIVYVIDAAAEEAVVQQSLHVLRDTLTHPCMRGKPLLLLANKKDVAGSRREAVVPAQLVDELLRPSATPYRVVATCAIAQDAALEDGFAWLLDAVRADYAALRSRVDRDTAHVRAEKARARAEQLAQLHKDD